MPVLPRLVYCSFVVSFKIQKCGSNLVLFSQDSFGYSGCFAFPCEFWEWVASLCKRGSWGLIGIVEFRPAVFCCVFFFFNLFLVALGLGCCVQAFSSSDEQQFLLLESTGSGHAALSGCSPWAQ